MGRAETTRRGSAAPSRWVRARPRPACVPNVEPEAAPALRATVPGKAQPPATRTHTQRPSPHLTDSRTSSSISPQSALSSPHIIRLHFNPLCPSFQPLTPEPALSDPSYIHPSDKPGCPSHWYQVPCPTSTYPNILWDLCTHPHIPVAPPLNPCIPSHNHTPTPSLPQQPFPPTQSCSLKVELDYSAHQVCSTTQEPKFYKFLLYPKPHPNPCYLTPHPLP